MTIIFILAIMRTWNLTQNNQVWEPNPGLLKYEAESAYKKTVGMLINNTSHYSLGLVNTVINLWVP
jgi:hypothetical protein